MPTVRAILPIFLIACSGGLSSEPGKVTDTGDTGDTGGCDAVDLDCDGVCFGASTVDMCGVCDADPANDCEQDCDGVWDGSAVEDDCGVCSGGDSGHVANSDMDCDGVCFGPALPETWYIDSDGDGFGDLAAPVEDCVQPSDTVSDSSDCDDSAAAVNPDALEVCDDGVDNDCDAVDTPCDPVSMATCPTRIMGELNGGRLGLRMDTSLDANGDGVRDLVLSSPGDGFAWTSTDAGAGHVWIVDGTVTGDYVVGSDARTLAHLVGDEDAELFGMEVTVGDVDDDGHPDLVVGAPRGNVIYIPGAEEPYWPTGEGYAFSGAPGAMSGTLDPTDAFAHIQGHDYRNDDFAFPDLVGWDFSATGDLNGDGVTDLALNSAWFTNPDDATTAYIFFGPVTGVEDAADADVIIESIAEPTLTENQSVLPRILPDIDGDGLDDLMMCFYRDDHLGADTGACYIYFGPFSTGDFRTDLDADAVIWGAHAGLFFGGNGVTEAVGDFNADGQIDLALSGYGFHPSSPARGSAYIFHGPITADLTSDDADAWFHGSDPVEVGWDITNAEDLNGDGILDFAIGGPWSTLEGVASGAVFVHYGPVTGENIYTDADLIYMGEASGDYAGHSVYSVDDINQDGLGDIAIASPMYGDLEANGGAVYLCTGVPDDCPRPLQDGHFDPSELIPEDCDASLGASASDLPELVLKGIERACTDCPIEVVGGDIVGEVDGFRIDKYLAIHNAGQTDAGAFTVQVNDSAGTAGTIFEVEVAGLASGDWVWVGPVSPDSDLLWPDADEDGLVDGTCLYTTITIDVFDDVEECDEANNSEGLSFCECLP